MTIKRQSAALTFECFEAAYRLIVRTIHQFEHSSQFTLNRTVDGNCDPGNFVALPRLDVLQHAA